MFSQQVAQWNGTRETMSAVVAALSEALTFADEFRDEQGKRFDEVGAVEGQGYNLREAIIHGQQAMKTFQALKPDKNKPLPTSTWTNALGSITELRNAASGFAPLIAATRAASSPLAITTGSKIILKENSGLLADFTGSAVRLVGAADALLVLTAPLVTSARVSAIAKNDQEAVVVADDAKATAAAVTQAEQASRDAREILEEIGEVLDRVSTTETDAKANTTRIQAEVSKAAEEVTALLVQVKSNAATVQDQATAASTRFNDVTALKSRMETTEEALTSYQSTLNTTDDRVKKTQAAAAAIVEEFTGQRDNIAKLLQEAQHMLSASTVAGLATAFDQERQSLARSMLWAQLWFMLGIILLMITTVPLFLYVSNIPMDWNSISKAIAEPKKSSDYELTLAGVVSRGVIILGPFWLTLFSARRYRSLFDLKQQYSHKYNMAFSMDGFKKQAVGFEENIAAWVFSIVAASPVQQKPGSPMDEAPSTSFKDFVDVTIANFKKVFVGSGSKE